MVDVSNIRILKALPMVRQLNLAVGYRQTRYQPLGLKIWNRKLALLVVLDPLMLRISL